MEPLLTAPSCVSMTTPLPGVSRSASTSISAGTPAQPITSWQIWAAPVFPSSLLRASAKPRWENTPRDNLYLSTALNHLTLSLLATPTWSLPSMVMTILLDSQPRSLFPLLLPRETFKPNDCLIRSKLNVSFYLIMLLQTYIRHFIKIVSLFLHN